VQYGSAMPNAGDQAGAAEYGGVFAGRADRRTEMFSQFSGGAGREQHA
jgi:hypothetical protein